VGLGGDLAEDHDHTGLGGSLAGNLGERVLPEAGIEDGVRDLIAAGKLRSVEDSRRVNVCVRPAIGTSLSLQERDAADDGRMVRAVTYQILSGWPSPTDSEVKLKVFWGLSGRFMAGLSMNRQGRAYLVGDEAVAVGAGAVHGGNWAG
jgi:hypothetical protein